jgi:proteic killer suppression protein
MTQVHLSQKAEKQLKKIPKVIIERLFDWIETLQTIGLLDARKLKDYHDEPLKGDRHGQRSIRLNKQWRAIYKELNGYIEIEVLEVTPHDY